MALLRTRISDRIAVCDGGKLLILENVGDDRDPNLTVRECLTNANPRTSATGRDTPGRVFEASSGLRSSVDTSDAHQRREDEFLIAIVDRLNSSASKREFASIAIVAPPRALGVMRAHYSDALLSRIRVELAQDLVHCPVSEIESRLFGR